MLRDDSHFASLLELEEVLAVVDSCLSPTAILHLQNGLILPPRDPARDRSVGRFQRSFHRDFPRYLEGYVASVNTFLAIDEFTIENGATLLVPGSHQRAEAPDREEMEAGGTGPVPRRLDGRLRLDALARRRAESLGPRSAGDQPAVHALVHQAADRLRPRARRGDGDTPRAAHPQLLGWYTRVVTSLDEYYRSPEERLYRSGQG